MNFLSFLLRAGYFFVLIELINSYLLIAANLNDFRTIAKKLVPEDFANRLSKVISKSTLRKVSEPSYENSDYEETDNLSENRQNIKVKPKINLDIQGTKVDFDELVERVKKRVEEELKNKYIEKKQNDKETKTQNINQDQEYSDVPDNKPNKIKANNYKKMTSPPPETEEEAVYEDLDYEEAVTEKPKYIQKVLKYTTKDVRYEYADAMADYEGEKEKNIDNTEKKTGDKIYYDFESVTQNELFKKIDMVKKDSYEDYKVPEKDKTYYSSEKQNKKRFKIEQRPKTTRKTKHGYKFVSQVGKSEEIAAVTADLLYDDNDTEIISDQVIEKKNKADDRKLGTMIPKRELYTIITPNYIDKVPHVVEKYNFNEPIPERDQEREVVKYFGNPPASVNKKVRLL